MKRKLRSFLDFFFKKVGIQTIRIYELDYLKEKFDAAVEELYGAFSETVSSLPPEDEKRRTLLQNLYGTTISEALYILTYLHKSLKFAGDVCEFGVAMGATSTLLANEIKDSKKNLWLFDSFQGLSKPTEKDILINDMFHLGKMNRYEGTMSYHVEHVLGKLNSIKFPKNRTKIVKGYIENSVLQKNLPKKVCFAYIDFDLYNPTILTLEFLHKHLSRKGYIIVDDYKFFSKGVETAVKEFLSSHKGQYKLILPHNFAGKFCILYKN